ncbi:LamB/YcsF family protein [Dechloromonas sp. XY25]|uniref:5-oxoprolinase subunit A n=1 Tax=Dechloromonas hankyongensis TaxID=2908002 RepID=A0ABS9K1E7_9RHOO|nr:5-oxoprolinase subunit PxpA [Dechloromonas hankyongensis]MCG2576997.1 LamB/YcsF family protein [Dechloromonas hankyongensis]
MSIKINLNADLGESYGAWTMGNDADMLPLVGSANLACGFHGGDPLVMRKTLQLARHHGVGVGAHPSYPDLQGFGRRRMAMAPDELEAAILYQIAALDGMARTEGLRVQHVKPHGALNNAACADRALADTIVRAIRAYDPALILLAPALSELCAAGHAAGQPVVEEIFADRAYLDDGQLVPRSRPDAMVHGAEASYAHVRRMLDEGAIVSVTGKRLPCRIGSICVHGDGAEAVATARYLRERLSADGCTLVGLTELAA